MKYYSIYQVAEKLKLTRQRIHQLIQAGEIISEKFGKFRLIADTELQRIIKKRRSK